ncbi:Uncharacterised protein [Dermatophilus congolensis]|uniref:Uncharacterized protein n=1 Tax=Dermatophilus congolensis TaxID=1863 RepID=A0AA46H150_9MICO|nr:Uncharacterised protein [Dermatophilus congolensis]
MAMAAADQVRSRARVLRRRGVGVVGLLVMVCVAGVVVAGVEVAGGVAVA